MSLTNKATIAEGGKYRHQPHRSHRLIKAQVRTIRGDRSLSRALQTRTGEGHGRTKLVIARRENNLRFITHAGCWFK